MEIAEKQLPSKTNLGIFCNLTALILGENSVKSITFTEIDKEIKFKGSMGKV